MAESVLIVGAGVGLSASIARKCFEAGMHITLAARNIEKIKHIAEETKAAVFACDASEPEQVMDLFKQQDRFGRS